MYLRNLLNKIKLPFRKDKELYRRLYAILGFYPNNIAYYKQALLHKSSSVTDKNGHRENNERLEFLGDAILDAIVGDIVYRHFEGKREGFLTNTRSKIVQRESLGKLAVEMGLDKLIQSNGQRNSHNSYMAGNAFEAIVGAIYLDYGYEQCMRFMKKRILSKIINIDKVAYQEVNFKSKLLEWSQKNRIRLEYKDKEVRSEKSGQNSFTTLVVIEGLDCGRGKGYSKKESQQNASKETLLLLKKQKGFEESIFEAKSRRTAMEEQPETLLPDIPDELLMEKNKQPKQEKQQPKQDQPKQEKQQPKQDQPKQEKQQPKQDQPKQEKQQPKQDQAMQDVAIDIEEELEKIVIVEEKPATAAAEAAETASHPESVEPEASATPKRRRSHRKPSAHFGDAVPIEKGTPNKSSASAAPVSTHSNVE